MARTGDTTLAEFVAAVVVRKALKARLFVDVVWFFAVAPLFILYCCRW